MEKIKISAVSYLNTKPMLFGLVKSSINSKIDLQLDIPSRCAQKLQNGTVDLGLVPVAIIPQLKNPKIISDYCIGTVGAVETVCIFSDRPIEELTHIYLDFHSRTSVELTKILVREYWKLNLTFIQAKEGFEDEIKGTYGGLIIGDRAMGLKDEFKYVYDLGAHWLNFTGLPFVFAAWVANKEIDPEFLKVFNEALKSGVEAIPELMLILPEKSDFDLQSYFTKYISYQLDAPKKEALSLFLSKIKEHQRLPEFV